MQRHERVTFTLRPADPGWKPHPESEIDYLRRAWGAWYAVNLGADGTWSALELATSELIVRQSASGLQDALRQDWMSRRPHTGWHK